MSSTTPSSGPGDVTALPAHLTAAKVTRWKRLRRAAKSLIKRCGFDVTPVERIEDPTSSTVYLTFDDGPHPLYTEAICEALEADGHRATFFFSGCQAKQHPELVRRATQAGHGVGTHSHRHLQQWQTTAVAVLVDYLMGYYQVARSMRRRPRVFRPPYGFHDWRSTVFTRIMGLTQYDWTLDPEDWKPGITSGQIIEALPMLEAGDIVLLHDHIVDNPDARDRTATVEAVKTVAAELAARNFISKPLPTS